MERGEEFVGRRTIGLCWFFCSPFCLPIKSQDRSETARPRQSHLGQWANVEPSNVDPINESSVVGVLFCASSCDTFQSRTVRDQLMQLSTPNLEQIVAVTSVSLTFFQRHQFQQEKSKLFNRFVCVIQRNFPSYDARAVASKVFFY